MMTQLEMLALIEKYDKKRKFSKDDYVNLVSIKQPSKINISEKIEKDKNGKFIYQSVTIQQFEQKITETQHNIPFVFEEGVWTKKTKNQNYLEKKLPTAFIDISEKTMVCNLGATGYGLVVIDPNGIPAGSVFLYSSTLYSHDDKFFIDPYASGEKNNYFSSLYCGGLARFVQGAPTNENLKKLFNLPYEIKQAVATANVELIADKRYLYYKTLNKIKYGEQILCDWGIEYWQKFYVLFNQAFRFFTKELNMIAVQHTKLPVEIFFFLDKAKKSFCKFNVSYHNLKFTKKSLEFSHSEKDRSFSEKSLSREEIKSLLDFLENFERLYFKEPIPSYSTWQEFQKNYPKKTPLEDIGVYSDITVPFANKINEIAKIAYQQGNYKDVIRLTSWLIFHAIFTTATDSKTLANYYLNIGNAYHELKYFKTSAFLLENATEIKEKKQVYQSNNLSNRGLFAANLESVNLKTSVESTESEESTYREMCNII